MRRGVLALLALASTALALALVGVATAQDETAPTLVEADAVFPDRALILTLPDERRVVPEQVKVTENGAEVQRASVSIPGEAGSPGAATILAIDASNSMRGQPIVDAMAAAREFARTRAPGTRLGVVTFNSEETVLLPPTTNQQQIDAALARTPELREKTHLYDALVASLQQLEETGVAVGSIVLLSDGNDIGSTTPPEDALGQLQDARVRVFGVGLQSDQYTPDALQELADGTNGAYSEAASSAELSSLFSEIGAQLRSEYLIVYRSLATPETDVEVAVAVPGYSSPATLAYTTPALELLEGPYEPSSLDEFLQSDVLFAIVILAAIALLGWGVSLVARTTGRTHVRQRLAQFVSMPTSRKEPEQAALPPNVYLDTDLGLRRSRFIRGFAAECELGDVKASPALLILGSVFGGLFLALVLTVLTGVGWLMLVAPVPWLLTRGSVRRRVATKRAAFQDQLPDNLEVLASALRAGHSLPGALAVMADNASEPSQDEFRRVVADEQLGVPLDEALETCVSRMANRDLEQVALVALLQRESGGNAAEVIDQVAVNIRVKMELRRLVRTLTAQGRFARWVLTFLPVGIFLALFMIARDFLRPLWTTNVGMAAWIVAIVLTILGSLIIKKIVDIEI